MHKKLFTYVLLFSSVLLEIGYNHNFIPYFILYLLSMPAVAFLLTAQYITFFQRQSPRRVNLLRVALKTTGAKQFAAKYFGQPIILTQPRVRMKHFLLKHL